MIFYRHASLYVSILLHNRQGKSQHLRHMPVYISANALTAELIQQLRDSKIHFSNAYMALMEYETLLRTKTDHYGHPIASAIIH